MLIFRRTNCISAASGIVTLVTCVLNSQLKRVTILDTALIQFVLLKMSIKVLETCIGI